MTESMQICGRLCALGVPKYQRNQLIDDIQRWVKHSGEEWTVERLKALKLELVTLSAGKRYPAPWVKRNKSGNPSGVWSWLFSTKRLTLEQKLNVLMVYSHFVSRQMTKKQRKKFFGSMESDSVVGMEARFKTKPAPVNVSDLVPWKEEPGEGWIGKEFPFPTYFGPTSSETAPNLFGKSSAKSNYFTHWVTAISNHQFLNAYVDFPLVFRAGAFPYTTLYDVDYPVDKTKFPMWDAVGIIAAIQEPGYKLRAVASPLAMFQVALTPLKNMIYRALKQQPGDCTHDQQLGVEKVVTWLNEGRVCYSVDMTDATNLFPLPMQIALLRDIFVTNNALQKKYVDQAISLFERVSRGNWLFKEPDGTFSVHRFTRGQPLGVIPSFGCFALAHNVLLQGICQRHNIPMDTYVVCGDDVVISHPELHRRYRAALNNLGCQVSGSKTLQSRKIAEFAGYIITKDRYFHTYKWRGIGDPNFLAIAREYGPRSLSLLRKRQRRLVKALGPIPQFLGGFGWNPKGESLERRLQSPLAKALSEAKYGDSSMLYHTYENISRRVLDFTKVWAEALLDPGLLAKHGLGPVYLSVDPFLTESGADVYSPEGDLIKTTSLYAEGTIWDTKGAQLCIQNASNTSPVIIVPDTASPGYTLIGDGGIWRPMITKEVFSPSRKYASTLLEATVKMEKMGVPPRAWKSLRHQAKRAIARPSMDISRNSLESDTSVYRPSRNPSRGPHR